jgi:hypothetical protein
MKMKINSEDFRVRSGENIKLKKWPTHVKPYYKSKKRYQELLQEHIGELSSPQRLHWASNRYALLLIFQGMDSAGNDGAIRHVMSGVNPQGCQVFSFKQPSAEEMEHDFLCRTTRRLPERGQIGIFNRSYYEEVLIVRVHPEILLARGLSDDSVGDRTVWKIPFPAVVYKHVDSHPRARASVGVRAQLLREHRRHGVSNHANGDVTFPRAFDEPYARVRKCLGLIRRSLGVICRETIDAALPDANVETFVEHSQSPLESCRKSQLREKTPRSRPPTVPVGNKPNVIWKSGEFRGDLRFRGQRSAEPASACLIFVNE